MVLSEGGGIASRSEPLFCERVVSVRAKQNPPDRRYFVPSEETAKAVSSARQGAGITAGARGTRGQTEPAERRGLGAGGTFAVSTARVTSRAQRQRPAHPRKAGGGAQRGACDRRATRQKPAGVGFDEAQRREQSEKLNPPAPIQSGSARYELYFDRL